MARFRLIGTHVINHKTLKAGTVICDGTSCQAGDYKWTGLNANTVSDSMSPLDAGANTLLAASRYPGGPVYPFSTGATSIEG